MSTVQLWANSKLLQFAECLSREKGDWDVYTSSGRFHRVHLDEVRNDFGASAFALSGHLKGAMVHLEASPSEQSWDLSQKGSDKTWNQLARSFRSAVTYSKVYEVQGYPATLTIKIRGNADAALAWLEHNFSQAEAVLVRGGVLENDEPLHGATSLSPNPWLYPSLTEKWPRSYDTYLTSMNAPDVPSLERLAASCKTLNGLVALILPSSAQKEIVLSVKPYSDIAAANRMFRTSR